MRIIIAILCFFAITANAGQLEVGSFNWQAEKATLNLHVNNTPKFAKSLLEALKSGENLQLNYSIKLMELKLWPKTLASGSFTRQVRFKHRNNSFVLTEGDVSQEFKTQKPLLEAIMWVDDFPMLIKHKLTTGLNTNLHVTLEFEPVSGNNYWLEVLSLDKFWKTRKLEIEELYVVR